MLMLGMRRIMRRDRSEVVGLLMVYEEFRRGSEHMAMDYSSLDR